MSENMTASELDTRMSTIVEAASQIEGLTDMMLADTLKTSPDATGTKVVQGTVPFIQTTTTKRGRYLSTNYFAVDAKNYGDGWKDGRRCFDEYMRSLAGKGWCTGNFIDVVKELALALKEGDPKTNPLCRHGAAVGFLREVERVLIEAADSRAGHRSPQTREQSPSRSQKTSTRGNLSLVWSAPA